MPKFDVTEYSKTVGWDGSEIRKYPTSQYVQELRESALAGNQKAAMVIMRYHRYLRSPETADEVETMNLLCDVYKELF